MVQEHSHPDLLISSVDWPDYPIVDIHTHPSLEGQGRVREEIQAIVDYGKGFGVTHMVVLGDVLLHGRLPTAEQVRSINDHTAQLVSWFPDYFSGFCFLNPVLGDAFVRDESLRCMREFGFKGIKLEICNNAIDPCMDPVMEMARDLRVPVLQHTADQTNIGERAFHSDPEDTAELGRRHPDVDIIMAHLTACGRRGVDCIRDVANVVVDTSAYQPEWGLVEYAVDVLGKDRVLYGSDLVIRDLPVQIGRIHSAQVPESTKRAIFSDNAKRLLAWATA